MGPPLLFFGGHPFLLVPSFLLLFSLCHPLLSLSLSLSLLSIAPPPPPPPFLLPSVMSADAKKVVLKLDLHDHNEKRKAMKAVSKLAGIDSIVIDMKGKTLTVTGVMDPVSVARTLRKSWHVDFVSVGPAKEEKKKEEPKKDQPKKKEELKKQVEEFYKYPNPFMMGPYYVQLVEENPSTSCVIS